MILSKFLLVQTEFRGMSQLDKLPQVNVFDGISDIIMTSQEKLQTSPGFLPQDELRDPLGISCGH